MIRPLRGAHRVAWSLLALGLPVLYAAALAARPPRPAPVELPAAAQAFLSASGPASVASTRAVAGPWRAGTAARARRLRAPADEARDAEVEWVEVELLSTERSPDLLVYWLAGAPSGDGMSVDFGGRLSEAWLLGEAPRGAARRYALPVTGEGSVVLFSLVHRSAEELLYLPEGDG